MAGKEKIRLDKYLWAIRLFKTRSLATEACNLSKVKFNGTNVKPSRTVGIGDKYEVRTEVKKWQIEVTSLLDTRVQYAEAIKHYIDHTPQEISEKAKDTAFVFYTGKRKSKQGRPTKKTKRELDEFMDEDIDI